jgi:hypothetical protein
MSKGEKFIAGTWASRDRDAEILKIKGKKDPYMITAPEEFIHNSDNRIGGKSPTTALATDRVCHMVYLRYLNRLMGKIDESKY